MLTNKTILITGGSGSFGNTFVPMTLAKYKVHDSDRLSRALDDSIIGMSRVEITIL
jgi:nucleoside-diphosphate-sugar epimerase